jgi:hypothetical protein
MLVVELYASPVVDLPFDIGDRNIPAELKKNNHLTST